VNADGEAAITWVLANGAERVKYRKLYPDGTLASATTGSSSSRAAAVRAPRPTSRSRRTRAIPNRSAGDTAPEATADAGASGRGSAAASPTIHAAVGCSRVAIEPARAHPRSLARACRKSRPWDGARKAHRCSGILCRGLAVPQAALRQGQAGDPGVALGRRPSWPLASRWRRCGRTIRDRRDEGRQDGRAARVRRSAAGHLVSVRHPRRARPERPAVPRAR
jgi:hypothetical protein